MMKNMPIKKSNLKLLLIAVLCGTLVYTGCRKSDSSAPSNTPADIDEMHSQLAQNLVASINGNFGGVNLMSSVDSVSLAGRNVSKAGYPALCGFFTDSVVNFNQKIADTTLHTGGNLTLHFDCTNNQPSGYTAYDSLNTTRTTPKGSSQYYVKQYYTIQSMTDNHQLIGVNGYNYYYNSTTVMCGCNKLVTTIESSNYILKDLRINVCGCSRDILSGTATFTAYGKGWSISGSMVFLGNYMADMTIDGDPKTYHVNLKTHKITS